MKIKYILLIFCFCISCDNATEKETDPAIHSSVQKGNEFLEAREWQSAKQSFTDYLELSDETSTKEAFEGRGYANLMLGYVNGAKSDFSDALNINDNLIHSRAGLGLIEYSAGNYQKAESHIANILVSNPKYVHPHIIDFDKNDLHFTKVLILFNTKDFKEAYIEIKQRFSMTLSYLDNDPQLSFKLLKTLEQLKQTYN